MQNSVQCQIHPEEKSHLNIKNLRIISPSETKFLIKYFGYVCFYACMKISTLHAFTSPLCGSKLKDVSDQ